MAGWARTRWPTEDPRPGTGRPVVLVADDNADMRLQLQRILSAHYDVLTAADGEAALEVARGVEPALIVTDVMMPKLDGFGLVNALRQDADLAMIPVVMLSARAGIEAAGEALLAGAEDYLIKPFRSRDLLTRVAARLDAAARTRSWHDEEVGAAGRAAIHAHLAEAVSGAMSIKDVVVAVRGVTAQHPRGDDRIGGRDPCGQRPDHDRVCRRHRPTL